MTMKEYLDQGPLLEQRIQYHTRRLEELRAAIYTITSSRLQADRVQISRNRDPGFVRALEGIEQMEARIAGEISLTEALKEQGGISADDDLPLPGRHALGGNQQPAAREPEHPDPLAPDSAVDPAAAGASDLHPGFRPCRRMITGTGRSRGGDYSAGQGIIRQ